MAKQENKISIYVYAHWQGMDHPWLTGVLHSDRLRGKEVFSFEYNEDWLRNGPSQLLDPGFTTVSGPPLCK